MKEFFEINNIWESISIVYSSLLFRYFLVAGLAYLVFYFFKKDSWFYKKIQQKFPDKKHVLDEIKWSLVTFIIFTVIGLLVIYAKMSGLTLIYTDISEYGWFYFVFSIIAAIFLHDTYFYWTHRLMHIPALFKIFHKRHHISHNPTPWAAFSFHPLEAIVEAGIFPVLAFILPLHPFAILAFFIFMTVTNVIGHLGYELFPSGFTKHWFGRWNNTSTHHNMHHRLVKCNFGLYFNIWDRIMGTNHPEYDNTFEQIKTRETEYKSLHNHENELKVGIN